MKIFAAGPLLAAQLDSSDIALKYEGPDGGPAKPGGSGKKGVQAYRQNQSMVSPKLQFSCSYSRHRTVSISKCMVQGSFPG